MSTDYWSCGASIQALLSARSVNMAACVATADRMRWQQAVSGCLQPDELVRISSVPDCSGAENVLDGRSAKKQPKIRVPEVLQ
jgi:hypothetical protein